MTAEEVETTQSLMPIVCVDLLPLRETARGREVGLISRSNMEDGIAFALVGGRILRGETIAEAIERQVRETLGPAVSYEPCERPPDMILEYVPGREHDLRFGRDPLKHSVGLTWRLELGGEETPGGEATGFRWFAEQELPHRSEIAFRQWIAIEHLLGVRLPD